MPRPYGGNRLKRNAGNTDSDEFSSVYNPALKPQPGFGRHRSRRGTSEGKQDEWSRHFGWTRLAVMAAVMLALLFAVQTFTPPPTFRG